MNLQNLDKEIRTSANHLSGVFETFTQKFDEKQDKITTENKLDYALLSGDIPEIPSAVSQLENDLEFATEQYVDDAISGIQVEDTRDYLCFEAVENNSTLHLDKYGNPYTVSLEYSTDKKTWYEYTWSGISGATITLVNAGDKVYFRGDNNHFSKGTEVSETEINDFYYFIMTGKINASGNIMSLLDSKCLSKTIPDAYSFANLFYGCASLITAPELPALELKSDCYYGMFAGTKITTAPELPAYKLATGCYSSMFEGCTDLISCPRLPALEIAYSCYNSMFKKCTSLTTPPELPAILLKEMCYAYMFDHCSSLITAPELPAPELATNCYLAMFQLCTSLKYVKVAFSDFSDGTTYWLFVNPGGTLYCPSALDTSVKDYSHIPAGWDVVYTEVEESKLGGGGGNAEWGSISGELSAQTDLQNALDSKLNSGVNTGGLFAHTIPASLAPDISTRVFRNGYNDSFNVLSGSKYILGAGNSGKDSLYVRASKYVNDNLIIKSLAQISNDAITLYNKNDEGVTNAYVKLNNEGTIISGFSTKLQLDANGLQTTLSGSTAYVDQPHGLATTDYVDAHAGGDSSAYVNNIHFMQGTPNANEIWYYASEQVTLNNSTNVWFHTFADGKGVLRIANHIADISTWLRDTPVYNIKIGANFTSIGTDAFKNCSNLALTELPLGITSIGDKAFWNCPSIQHIELPSGITSIGVTAFNACSNLQHIELPSGIASIGEGAFANCLNLRDIYVSWSEGEVAGAPWGATNATIHYNAVYVTKQDVDDAISTPIVDVLSTETSVTLEQNKEYHHTPANGVTYMFDVIDSTKACEWNIIVDHANDINITWGAELITGELIGSYTPAQGDIVLYHCFWYAPSFKVKIMPIKIN